MLPSCRSERIDYISRLAMNGLIRCASDSVLCSKACDERLRLYSVTDSLDQTTGTDARLLSRGFKPL